MTRSIFDPTGPNTERSGNRYLGPDADNRSHMPEDAIDGVAGDEKPKNDTIDMNPDDVPEKGLVDPRDETSTQP